MKKFSLEVKNIAGYHPGPVTPSTTDGAPLLKTTHAPYFLSGIH